MILLNNYKNTKSAICYINYVFIRGSVDSL